MHWAHAQSTPPGWPRRPAPRHRAGHRATTTS